MLLVVARGFECAQGAQALRRRTSTLEAHKYATYLPKGFGNENSLNQFKDEAPRSKQQGIQAKANKKGEFIAVSPVRTMFSFLS